jgi:glucuronosyltransferase
MKTLVILLVILAVCDISMGSRILFLYPTPSKSHLIVVQGLSTTLALKGHEITVISPFTMSRKMKNYRDIELPLTEDAKDVMKSMVMNPNQSMLKMLPNILRAMNDMNKNLMELPEYKKLLRDEKFDLVVIGMFSSNFLVGVGDHFKCPTIMLSVNVAFTTTNLLFGNPLGISTVPHMHMKLTTNSMSFLDRTKNFGFYVMDLLMNAYMDYEQRKLHE